MTTWTSCVLLATAALACDRAPLREPPARVAPGLEKERREEAFEARYTMLTTSLDGAKHKRIGETVEVDAREPIPRSWQGVHACAALSELVGGHFECIRAQRWACEDGDDSGSCFERVPCQRPVTSFEPDPKHLATARAECRRTALP